MTEGGLAAASDLHCLPTSDIGDASIGRIIDRYSSPCYMPCGSFTPLAVLGTAPSDGCTDTVKRCGKC
jgi:hypothetical protein